MYNIFFEYFHFFLIWLQDLKKVLARTPSKYILKTIKWVIKHPEFYTNCKPFGKNARQIQQKSVMPY